MIQPQTSAGLVLVLLITPITRMCNAFLTKKQKQKKSQGLQFVTLLHNELQLVFFLLLI